MPHEAPLIATIVAGIVLAFIFGAIANRLRLPSLVGYLFAGILVGPHTPGFIADQSLAAELAELGVILLMFGVGLHFSFKDLLSVKSIAVPGAIAQIAIASAMGVAIALLLGWSFGGGLVFGLALSVASTVVLLRALQERRLVDTKRGRIAVGWLIVEDLAMVLTLVLLPAVAGILGGDGDAGHASETYIGNGIWAVLIVTFVKVASFVAVMMVFGRRIIPWLLRFVVKTGSRELFRLAVLAIALGTAFGAAEMFGVSLALGAFFAGMIMSESELSHQAAQETLPLRDAFSVLFFVAMGMLFNPASLLNSPLPILATLFVVLIGKSIAAFVIVRVFRYPVATALTISASLAQIGEFSFILAGLGVALGLMPAEGRDLILTAALLSIILNPLAFAAADWLTPLLENKMAPKPGAEPEAEIQPDALPPARIDLSGHIVLVGYGRIGRIVAKAIVAAGLPVVVIEDGDRPLEALRQSGLTAIAGNAATTEILDTANLAAARQLIVAIPNVFEAGRVVEQARATNPNLQIVTRARSEAEAEHLSGLGADIIITEANEIANGMIGAVQRCPPADQGQPA
jgi:CPA2 family monovalent cation:H+ antiporter-2